MIQESRRGENKVEEVTMLCTVLHVSYSRLFSNLARWALDIQK